MRRLLRTVLLLAVVIAGFGYLVYRSRGAIKLEGFSWALFAHSVREARLSLIVAGVAGVFVCYAIRALRWISLSRYMGRPHLWNVYPATIMGFTGVFLLGRAGEPLRPLLIARKDRLSFSGTFGVYVLERVLDIGSTVALFGLSLLIAAGQISQTSDEDTVKGMRTIGVVLLAGLLLVIGFLVYFRLHGAGALERRLMVWRAAQGWRKRIAEGFVGFGQGLQAIRTLRDLLVAIGYSVAHWLLMAVVYLWLCHSFGDDLGDLRLASIVVVMAITMVGALVQLPGVGGGSQVAAFFALTGVFDIEKEPAAAAAILVWLVTFAACTLAGIPLLIHEGWSMHELWQFARAKKQPAILIAQEPSSVWRRNWPL